MRAEALIYPIKKEEWRKEGGRKVGKTFERVKMWNIFEGNE